MEVAWTKVMVVGKVMWIRELLGGRIAEMCWRAGLACFGRKRAKFRVLLSFWLENLAHGSVAY